MADGFKPLPRIQPGGVSMVSAKVANGVIDLVNAVGGAFLAPISNVGAFKLAGGRFILDLSPFDQRLRAVEGASLSLNLPFTIQQFGATNVNVRPGLVHNLNVTGTATNITMSANSVQNIYINATIDNSGVVTAAAIGNVIGNIPTDTAYQAYKWIGAVQGVSGNVGTIFQYTLYSQEFAACDRNIAGNTNGSYRFFVD